MLFQDRLDAGNQLAEKLRKYAKNSNAVLLALPRGGVAIALAVAKKLSLPLDILVARKVGAPGNPEFALGAVTGDGEEYLNERAWQMYDMDAKLWDRLKAKEQKEVRRREVAYRGGRSAIDLAGKTVILVDDGIATGATMIAAIFSAKKRGAAKVIAAAPVVAGDTKKLIESLAEVVFVAAPADFAAVGRFYDNFTQVTDDEVIAILKNYL